MQVLQLLEEGYSNYNKPEEFSAAMEQLVKENPTPMPGAATLELGQGTWEVRACTACAWGTRASCWCLPAPGALSAAPPACRPLGQWACHT